MDDIYTHIFILIAIIVRVYITLRKYRKFSYTLRQTAQEIAGRLRSKTAVYTIFDGKNYKIGISNNPIKRFSSLQTGNPKKLSLIKVVWFDTRELALKEEKQIHKELKKSGHWVHGEWFSDI